MVSISHASNLSAMLRRSIAAEPVATSARWSRQVATGGVALATAAVVVARSGVAEPRVAVAILGAGLGCAGLALLLAGRAAVVIWRTGYRGTGRALAAIVLAALVLAYPAWLAVAALRLPRLNDISTDLGAPPQFSSVPAVRAARTGVVHDDPPPQAREAQRLAYPEVQPVVLDLDGEEAFALAEKILKARRWRVLDAAPPRGQPGTGHLDAVARSPVMGFPEDVTIRFQPSGDQTRVDIRSASRFEPHDFGSNAARIEALAFDLDDQQ